MGTTPFDFRGLYVLDMANNHDGRLEHGLRIVRECGEVVAANGVRAAIKFQFRDLDTLVHPAHRRETDNKHIPRFRRTALALDAYREMATAVRQAGMVTMATPFDEASVDRIAELDIEVVKVASASATDWPLLERVSLENRPVIVSTGGLSLEAIDDIVSFFDHRRVQFALMHCVAIYPTPAEHLQLNQVEVIRRRHPSVVVGFSTHEAPDDLEPVAVAVAKGAEILERHVGVAADGVTLNAYSSTPAQLNAWIKAAERARVMCGGAGRPTAKREEVESLATLQRGIFAARPLKAGEVLERADVYFGIPYPAGGLRSGQWRDRMTVTHDIAKDGALSAENTSLPAAHPKAALFPVIHAVKAMLNEARIALPTDFRLEFSHHYGLERFAEVGAVLIDCVNREYCKKLIVQLPGQRHPNHYHKRKEETFQVLSGVMEAEVEGRRRTLYPGDVLVVPQGVWHAFWTESGLIFEEISSTHYTNDSFYEDKSINAMTRDERKTVVSHWGRYQLA
jgi:sialic acid synthase SpsE/quercetin dioxygenase-like cupin family protein